MSKKLVAKKNKDTENWLEIFFVASIVPFVLVYLLVVHLWSLISHRPIKEVK